MQKPQTSRTLVPHLLNRLETHKAKEFKAVVMPDFFFDRFVLYEKDFSQFANEAHKVVRRKGGSIDNVKQVDFRGGNAANTAAALARLGATVTPIIETDDFGFSLLKRFLEPYGVDMTHVKTKGKTAITTALEFHQNGGKVNLMLRDLGSLARFGPENLTEKDYQLLATADYVCVFNWAGTREHGTELAETVFRYVKSDGKGKTYYDTADPTPNKSRVPTLIKRVLYKDYVDILSLNENEAIQYATYISPKQTENLRKQHKKPENLALECAATLAQHFTSRIDLHTTAYSATFNKNKKPQITPSFKVRVLRATGAGDAWNAGNIYGDAQSLPDKARLTIANAVAAYYISSPKAAHPTLNELKNFIKTHSN
ncbi:MAG: carbohydrate kinase family protein [Candidatus Bathyarchaeia archaeon]|jgi:sugar/nucleoside kinase (ribokinase family)|nr:carbohydrate kinase family protein [Candidatus Bathyarchaeota archaeon A05DMB-4]MDH7595288.1 carbohydrate kinase family protein [Candidatus Bathyarchaeota archaeon]